jgi:hypothetical protein
MTEEQKSKIRSYLHHIDGIEKTEEMIDAIEYLEKNVIDERVFIYLKWLEDGNSPEPADIITPGYTDLRRAEYPSIGDQLDALFHAVMLPRELTIQIQAVKAKYPKV